MQNKRGVVVGAFIVIASVLLLFCSGVSVLASVTMYVDEKAPIGPGTDIGTQYAPFHTIDKALKKAKSGDTIIVAPGNYVQTRSIKIDNLTILGPNAGVPAGVNHGNRGDEAVIGSGLDIAANNVIFDGFTVQTKGVTIAKSKSGSVIANNVFVGPIPVNETSVAILVDTNSSITMKNNFFEKWNIGIKSDASTNLSITGNVFAHNIGPISDPPIPDDKNPHGRGVQLSDSTMKECSGNAFKYNRVGFYSDGATKGLVLHDNSFQHNTWFGVQNKDAVKANSIDASNNWWGAVSGPSWAGPGSGDRVDRFVVFEPWLTYDPSRWFSPGVSPVPPTGTAETGVVDETLQSQGVKPGQRNVVVQQVVIKDPATGTASDRHPTDISTVTVEASTLKAENTLAKHGGIDKISLVVDSNKNGTYEPGQDVVIAYRTLAFADPAVNLFVQTDSVTFGVPGKKLLQVPDKGQVRLFVVADISPTALLGEILRTSIYLTAENNLSSAGSVSSQFIKNFAEASADTVVAFATGDKETNLIDETKSVSIINGQKQAVIQEFVVQDPDGGADLTPDGYPTKIDTVTVRSMAGSTITAKDIARMWIVEETDGIPGYSYGDDKHQTKSRKVAGQNIDLQRDGVRFGDPNQPKELVSVPDNSRKRFYIVADFKDTLKDGDWLKTEITVTASDYKTGGNLQRSSDIENPVLVASNGVVMGAASGSGIPRVKGDVNGDGKVDVSDVRLVSRYILKVQGATLTAAQKVAGDVAPPHIPPDTNLDVTDVRWLSQVALGLKTLSTKAASANPLAITTPAKLEIDRNGRLNISGTTANLTDLQGQLLFDPAVLSVSKVIGLNGYTVLGSTIDNDQGKVRFIVSNLSSHPISGEPMVRFITTGDPTKAVIHVQVLRDAQGRNVPCKFMGQASDLDFVCSPSPITDVHTATFTVKGAAAALVTAVKVDIFDLAGQLAYSSEEIPGTSLDWHTNNNYGEYLANGVYLYKMYAKFNDHWIISDTKYLVILR